MKVEPIIDKKDMNIPFSEIPINTLYRSPDGCFCIKVHEDGAVQLMNMHGYFDTGIETSDLSKYWDAVEIYYDLKGFKISS